MNINCSVVIGTRCRDVLPSAVADGTRCTCACGVFCRERNSNQIKHLRIDIFYATNGGSIIFVSKAITFSQMNRCNFFILETVHRDFRACAISTVLRNFFPVSSNAFSNLTLKRVPETRGAFLRKVEDPPPAPPSPPAQARK